MGDEGRLTVLGHLEEVRSRLTKSLIAVAVGIIICFPLARYIYDILKHPVPGIELYYMNPTGLLGSYMLVCLYGGFALALPFLIYHFVMFLRPALTTKEKGYLYTLLPSALLLFFGGVLFCYFILLPPALKFLYYTFPDFVGGDIQPWWSVKDYVSVELRLLFWIGLSFEIPLLMYFLSKIGIITPQWILRKWKWAVVLAFILGALITPTFDPVNQTLVAAPILILFIIGYLLARLARRGRAEAAK